MRPMGLHDHFRPPLRARRQWHGFHHMWATYIAAQLNERLPEGYVAQPNIHFGVEVDVAAMEDRLATAQLAGPGAEIREWSSRAPTMRIALPIVTDIVETLVYSDSGEFVLRAAIELVSPANKDRPAHRDAFLTECQAYLQRGLGLVIVDVVTERLANLHRTLVERLDAQATSSLDADLYTAAYRPISRDGEPGLEVWEEALTIGQSLPTMPLWLDDQLCVPIDLDASYERACRDLRLPADIP